MTILTSFKCSNLSVEDSNCKEIKSCLDIELSFSADSIKYGEYLNVSVLYRNKTDTLLTFYPKAIVFLAKPLVGFEYESYSLNDTLDATLIAEVKPKSTYLYTFKILVKAPFFTKEYNHLRLGYVCKEMKGRFKIYNKLCGSLESQEVKLFVIP
ncbi:MAG: hypothetical protein GX638_13025 [Crenarchaeota archaeon]|nr:hypothetical protein [Thermoproteota archaeon]